MKVLLDRKNREAPIKRFIVLNEYCQVYCGLQQGYPAFSDNLDDAKELENDEMFSDRSVGDKSVELECYFCLMIFAHRFDENSNGKKKRRNFF